MSAVEATPGPLEDLHVALSRLRGLLDDIDNVPLGQVGAKLDDMAVLCDAALSIVEKRL